MRDAATQTTNKENFFERASAFKFSGYDPAGDLHLKIGEVFEEGKLTEAYQLIDEAFTKIRKGEMKRESQEIPEGQMSWEDFRKIAKLGYEFASHTVSHPYLSVLDDANLQYELEKSREEIRGQLGDKHTFSVECPFGTEDSRAVQAALKIYQLARNWMPDEEVQDLNRWDEQDPAASQKKYVRWQRGPLSDTSLELMKKWVDKIRQSKNVWLVLVFHGVDAIGWEPQSSAQLETYFKYIRAQDDIWVATFQDAGKHIRESLYTQVSAKQFEQSIEIDLANKLDRTLYDLPLTLKTYVPATWKAVSLEGGESLKLQQDEDGTYVIFNAVPNSGPARLRRVN